MQDFKLTVLDQSPVHPNETAAHSSNAGQMSIELAKVCDELGYARYWVAEHHNSPQFAGPCPEILIAAIASVTRNMRVGSGGVMLSHYSPYKVAETFNMLNALFPNRIDLGIGRAPGGDALASSALAWPSQPLDSSTYPGQASILKALLEHNLPDDHAWAGLHISPTLGKVTENIAPKNIAPKNIAPKNIAPKNIAPEMWMLGSSGGSAKLAGQVGMNLALARFISPDHCNPDIFDVYDQARAEAGHKEKANRMLAIACFCADSQEEAELLASTAVYRKMRLQPKGQEDLLTPEAVQNLRKKFTPIQEDQYRHLMEGYTVGTPERCKTEIDTLANAFGTKEIALVTVTHDFAARLKSYQLLMA